MVRSNVIKIVVKERVVGKVSIVDYPSEITVKPDEAIYFEIKVRNDYKEKKTVVTQLIDHEGKVRKDERFINPGTTVLISFYHPAIGKEGTFYWTLRVIADGDIEDEKIMKVISKKPIKPKYSVTVKWSGFSKPPYVKAEVKSDIASKKDFLPITLETEGWFRVSGIILTTRRPATEGYVWQYETGEHPKWIHSKESYPAPETPVTRITFSRYDVKLSCESRRVTDTTLTLLGVSSDGEVILVFSVKKFGTREVKGTIVESNGKVRFRWTCPVCGKVNENTEDKDRLEYLNWKVAEMCKKCDVQSYVYLR